MEKIPRNKLRIFRTALWFEMQLKTGFRLAELLSLRWSDIYDYDAQEVKKQVIVKRKNMKGKKKGRNIFLTDDIRALTAKYLQVYKPLFGTEPLYSKKIILIASGADLDNNDIGPINWHFVKSQDPKYVFRSSRSEQMDASTVSKMLVDLFARALGTRDRLNTHSLRKTFITNVYKATGEDIITTAHYSGHTNTNTLLHYIGIQGEQDSAVRDAILKL